MRSLVWEFMDRHGLTLLSIDRIHSLDQPFGVFRPFDEGFVELLIETLEIPMRTKTLNKSLSNLSNHALIKVRRISARMDGPGEEICLNIPKKGTRGGRRIYFNRPPGAKGR